MPPDLSIIIVTHNSREDILKCLLSWKDFCVGVITEIIVFDNKSIDGTADIVAQNYPEARVFRHPENVGFARANNLAVAHAHGHYVLLLNPDTWVDDDLASALVKFLDAHPEADACAPRVLTPGGTVQFSSVCALPTVELLFYEQAGLSQLFPRSPRFGRYRMTCWSHDEIRRVEHATAACLAIRREAYHAVGGFDESYFMYIEDVDFSYRLYAQDRKIFYLPAAHVFHAGSHSGCQMPIENFLELYRSFYLYFRKHHGDGTVLAVKVVMSFGLLLRIVALAVAVLFEKSSRPHGYWKNRRQQLAGHAVLFLKHWSY